MLFFLKFFFFFPMIFLLFALKSNFFFINAKKIGEFISGVDSKNHFPPFTLFYSLFLKFLFENFFQLFSIARILELPSIAPHANKITEFWELRIRGSNYCQTENSYFSQLWLSFKLNSSQIASGKYLFPSFFFLPPLLPLLCSILDRIQSEFYCNLQISLIPFAAKILQFSIPLLCTSVPFF